MKRTLLVLLLAACTNPSKPVTFHVGSVAEAVDVAGQNCQAITETATLAVNGAVPATALGGRRAITVCSDPRNDLLLQADGGTFRDGNRTPYVVCSLSGQTPSLAGPGTVLGAGDCVSAALNSGQPVKCIQDTADAGVFSTECR